MNLTEKHSHPLLLTTTAMPLLECLQGLVRDNRLLERLNCELTLRDGLERLYPFQLLLRSCREPDLTSALEWPSHIEQEAYICRSVHPEMYGEHIHEIEAAEYRQDILEVGFLVLIRSNKRIPIVITKSGYVTAI